MATERIAHISDLHVGRSAKGEAAAERVCAALLRAGVDRVFVTGDLTHGGRREEMQRFRAIFRPLVESGRMVAVPGNHDRLGEDAGRDLVEGGRRARGERQGALHAVRIDSTGPHNRKWLSGHGRLDRADVDAAVEAAEQAHEGAVVVALLHHHPLPLPGDDVFEHAAGLLGLPFTAELPRGRELVERLAGKCDLILHGHRHAEAGLRVPGTGMRPLWIYNAGSTTALGRFRIFTVRDGRLEPEPEWCAVDPRPEAPGALPALAGAPA